ncbi:MAG: hypothetical protein M3Q14_00280 [bacterium]|nr:hypothetical protein [bacterium]
MSAETTEAYDDAPNEIVPHLRSSEKTGEAAVILANFPRPQPIDESRYVGNTWTKEKIDNFFKELSKI